MTSQLMLFLTIFSDQPCYKGLSTNWITVFQMPDSTLISPQILHNSVTIFTFHLYLTIALQHKLKVIQLINLVCCLWSEILAFTWLVIRQLSWLVCSQNRAVWCRSWLCFSFLWQILLHAFAQKGTGLKNRLRSAQEKGFFSYDQEQALITTSKWSSWLIIYIYNWICVFFLSINSGVAWRW